MLCCNHICAASIRKTGSSYMHLCGDIHRDLTGLLAVCRSSSTAACTGLPSQARLKASKHSFMRQCWCTFWQVQGGHRILQASKLPGCPQSRKPGSCRPVCDALSLYRSQYSTIHDLQSLCCGATWLVPACSKLSAVQSQTATDCDSADAH